MKSSLIFVLISLTTNSLLATDSLFSYFNERPLGAQSSVEENRFGSAVEGAQITVFDIPLSTFEEIDQTGKRRGLILYVRKKPGELDDLFVKFDDLLTRQCGASKKFLVPNFEDATERETTMLVWKNDKFILLLAKISDSSSQSIDLQYYEITFHEAQLGADYKQHMDKELPKKAGILPSVPFLKDISHSNSEDQCESNPINHTKDHHYFYNWKISIGAVVIFLLGSIIWYRFTKK